MLLSQPRIFFAMAKDGLLPAGRLEDPPAVPHPLDHDDHHRPDRHDRRRASCRSSVAGELTSIGTLFAFAVVSAGVLVLRITQPEVERPFKTPLVWFTAPMGVISAVFLMAGLPLRHLDPAGRLDGDRPGDLLPLRRPAQQAQGVQRRARPERYGLSRLRGIPNSPRDSPWRPTRGG